MQLFAILIRLLQVVRQLAAMITAETGEGDTMNIAICDDMDEDRKIIEGYLLKYMSKTGEKFEIFNYESGESILSAMKKLSFQVIFLDIYMMALNGIETARKIRKFHKEVQIIFVTISPDHAISSYEVRALHYIMKPVSYSKIEKVLNLCKFEAVKAERQIEVLTGKVMTRVNLDQILYVEIFHKVLTIHTAYGEIAARISMENIEALLGGPPFLRCHRSFLVNMDYIEETKVNEFLLSGGRKVPISRPARAFSVKTYQDYIFSSMRKKLC